MRRYEVPLAAIILVGAVSVAALFQNCAGNSADAGRGPASDDSENSKESQDPTGGLPPATHDLKVGYYFADGRYGDYRDEVDCHTNLYLAWARRGYEESSEETDSFWLPRMKKGMEQAFIKKKDIYLMLNLQETAASRLTPIDDVLKAAKGVWSQVVAIELADEPAWNKTETENKLRDIRARITNFGLSRKPLGVVLTDQQALNTDALTADGLDFVGIEAYVPPPGQSESSKNVEYLKDYLKTAIDRVPADKKLVLIGMAYARNGGWTNMETLKDLQTPAYYFAYNNPRVLALTLFSYGRPSGTREHPELKKYHIQTGNAALNRTCKY